MKTKLTILALLLLMTALCVCAAQAEALPTLDHALTLGELAGPGATPIEISPYGGLEEYSYVNEGDATANAKGFRLIILQREAPKKEFTELDSGYPNDYIEGFPDDFTGVDLEEPRVWVRNDLMQMLPAEYRATSMANADFLVIAETLYDWAGTLTVTNYAESSGDTEIPDWIQSPEELAQYIANHQPVISSITYYPKFSVLSLISIFNAKSKVCEYLAADYTDAMRFARNPEAADLWDDLSAFGTMISIIEEDTNKEDGYLINLLLDLFEDSDYIQPGDLSFWKQCIDSGRYTTALEDMNQTYWRAAYRLAALDDEEDHQRIYEMVIESQDRETLESAANFFNYSGFDLEIETIRDEELYIAQADPDWFESNLLEIVQELCE